jgi:hypothetical protein
VCWSQITGDAHEKARNTCLFETACYGNLLEYGQCGCVQYISVHVAMYNTFRFDVCLCVVRFRDIRNVFFLSSFLSLGFRITVIQYLAQQSAQSIIIILIIKITCHVTASELYQPVQSQHWESIQKGIQDQHIVKNVLAHYNITN